MAGIIQKFIRGAAASGAQSFNEQYKAQLLAERDQRLEEVKAQAVQRKQKFTTERDERGFKHDREMAELKVRNGTGQDPAKTRAADILNQRRESEGLPPLPFQDALRVANMSVSDPTNAIVGLIKATMDQQAASLIEPGAEGYISPDQAKKNAIETVKNIRAAFYEEPEAPKGKPSPTAESMIPRGSQRKKAPDGALQYFNKAMNDTQDESQRNDILRQFKSKYGYLPPPYKQ